MKCKPAEQLMLDYIEGTLLPKKKDRLEIHLGACPHCQKVLVDYEKTLQLAGSLPVKYPSPDAWGNFWQKLKSKISQDVSNDEPVWLIAHKWKIAGVGFIFVALLGLAGLWSYGVFNNSAADPSASLDKHIFQNFMGGISTVHFQEVLSQELQRLDGAGLAWSGENLLLEEAGSSQPTGTNSLVGQLFEVIDTEVALEHFEDDELTTLVASIENKLILASSR